MKLPSVCRIGLALSAFLLVGYLLPIHGVHAYSAFPDPLNNADVPILVNRIVTQVLGLVGALFFVMFLWGGFQYMTAGGDAGKVKSARTTLLNAVIGIGLIALSYVIVGYILAVVWVGSVGLPENFHEGETTTQQQGTQPAPSDFSNPN